MITSHNAIQDLDDEKLIFGFAGDDEVDEDEEVEVEEDEEEEEDGDADDEDEAVDENLGEEWPSGEREAY